MDKYWSDIVDMSEIMTSGIFFLSNLAEVLLMNIGQWELL